MFRRCHAGNHIFKYCLELFYKQLYIGEGDTYSPGHRDHTISDKKIAYHTGKFLFKIDTIQVHCKLELE